MSGIPGAPLESSDSQFNFFKMYTASSSYPVERSIISSSADKYSNITTLQHLRKKTFKQSLIAPENPVTVIPAWTNAPPAPQSNNVVPDEKLILKNNSQSAINVFPRRSAQQLERDNLRQKSFTARRATSQPQLLINHVKSETDYAENYELNFSKLQSQVKRESHNNFMEGYEVPLNCILDQQDNGKDSKSNELIQKAPENINFKSSARKNKHCLPLNGNSELNEITAELQGLQTRTLEGEIGIIKGVYNINHDEKTVESQVTVGEDSEWIDIVETELKFILEPKLNEFSINDRISEVSNSPIDESISSLTSPVPSLPLGDNSSPSAIIKNNENNYLKGFSHVTIRDGVVKSKPNSYQKSPLRKPASNAVLRGKAIFGLDTADFTSTTTRSLDFESMLNGQSDSIENNNILGAKAIRQQLEDLETMYSKVLRTLEKSKNIEKYQSPETKFSKKRYGSISSLPSSSVSSIRRERRGTRGFFDDSKKGREPWATARRFQRLEAHVVTLARSVAHLSSEMRTQHLFAQEMEAVRQEVAALKAQTSALSVRSQTSLRTSDLPTLANPLRVKKLTKFFGDEPPLLRLFLRKLGYEKYAYVFEKEKIGMVELPYLGEERLLKLGIPLGPRLRIMQEAQIAVCENNTLCIV